MKSRHLLDSFNYAINGIIYTLKTQRNMRIHFIVATLVLIMSLFLDISKLELIILIFSTFFVILAEMINTAIEKTIDLYTDKYHPLAEVAKNVAAGAVLIAALNSIIVAYILFFKKLSLISEKILIKFNSLDEHTIFISFLLIITLVIIIKHKSKTGTPFKGGIISGHAAIAFSAATAISISSKKTIIFILSFILAFLVAQSRVEGKIHSILQVVFGSALGILITLLIFKLLG